MQQAAAFSPFVVSRTQADLGPAFGSVAGRGVYISFQWDQVRLKSADPSKNGQRERRLKLIKQPVGDSSTCSTSYITEEQARDQYPAEWEYFTKHGDMPPTGTPLSELPGISVSQMQIMQIAGLRSIEDVLGVPEEVINRIGLEGRYVRSVAEEWKKRATTNADLISVAELRAATDAALAVEKRRANQAQAEADALRARLDAMERLVGNMGGGMAPQPMAPVLPSGMPYQEGPDLDATANPLAEGNGELDDDPLDLMKP